MTTLMNDLRFALRTLRRAPSFTIAAILALGLGTGSAAGVYSLLRGVVLHGGLRKPEQLVSVGGESRQSAGAAISPVALDYRA